MTAAAWGPAHRPYAGPSLPRRPHLVLVPGGGGADERGELRLTTRGRVVVVAVLVLAATLGMAGIRGAGAAEPTRVVTVAPGQTLSEVAASELPDLSISEGILAIQLANDLSTAQVAAGQKLVVPSQP